MMRKFHPLHVTNITRETADAVSIQFDVPAELQEDYRYVSGQYLTLDVTINGTPYRRSYSLCSSPYTNEPLTIAVKRVHGGVVSSWLTEHITTNHIIQVFPPMGGFVKKPTPTDAKNYLLIAGGSGITPVLSIAKTILNQEPNSTVTLFYGNTNAASIIFADQLAMLATTYAKLNIVHVLQEPADVTEHIGLLDEQMVGTLLRKYVTHLPNPEVYLCGPPAMMRCAQTAMADFGIPAERIHREYFILDSEHSKDNTVEQQVAETDELITRTVKIKLYGTEYEFEVEPDETILTAAQRANIDPPYACQIGACCTCRAKVLSGKVRMDEREALSDEEIEDGYVLTCQSHPLTDGVIADYDL